MKALAKYWKVILAVLLVAAAALIYFKVYETEKKAYETELTQLITINTALQASIQKNTPYAEIQDQLDPAREAIDVSRLELYEHFPVELKEEDQIMYVLYLESLFGTEIFFTFNTAEPLVYLRDGSTLMGLTLTVNYETTYQGFQDMVEYLATDSRITSVRSATIEYDAKNDIAQGTVTLLLYLMDSDLLEYVSPDVAIPESGKDNIYD